MPGFTKLFSSIVSSSVWSEADPTRLLWITMLAIADRDGVVEASVPGLAYLARIAIDQTKAGLKRLMAPDPYSRNHEHDGRRIEEIDRGWRILNYDDYRFRQSDEDIREKNRIRKQRQRQRERHAVTRDNRDGAGQGVTNVTSRDSHACHDKAEAEAYIPHNSTNVELFGGESPQTNAATTPQFYPDLKLTIDDGSVFQVPVKWMDEWEKLFPSVLILQELRNMQAWLDANPERRKTRRGMKRFIVGWLGKEQHRLTSDNGDRHYQRGMIYHPPSISTHNTTPEREHVFCAVCSKDLGPMQAEDKPEDKFVCSDTCAAKSEYQVEENTNAKQDHTA